MVHPREVKAASNQGKQKACCLHTESFIEIPPVLLKVFKIKVMKVGSNLKNEHDCTEYLPPFSQLCLLILNQANRFLSAVILGLLLE